MVWDKKWTAGAVVGRDGCKERGERGARRGTHKENVSPRPLSGNMTGLNFLSSCNQPGLKPGVLKVGRLGWARGWRVLPYLPLERRQANNPEAASVETAI